MAKPTISSLQTKIALLEEELFHMTEHCQQLRTRYEEVAQPVVDLPWEQPKVDVPVNRREAMQAARKQAMATGRCVKA